MNKPTPWTVAVLSVLAAVAPRLATAGCGSTFCSINTQWTSQGAWQAPGWGIDARFEYITQDQPRRGTDDVGFGAIPRHHDERQTINRNSLLAADWQSDGPWGLRLTLPVVDRFHEHAHNHHGERIVQRWNFTEPGDARVLVRRALPRRPFATTASGLRAGLELPTGRDDVRNASGETAERSLQPGSGTVDMLLGAYHNGTFTSAPARWFVEGLIQAPVGKSDGYRPGNRVSLDAGVQYGATERVALHLQLNAQYTGRDRGEEAEPDDTGERLLGLSPGISYALTPQTRLYGYVQLPLYQRVNGVQLTADWSLALGLAVRL